MILSVVLQVENSTGYNLDVWFTYVEAVLLFICGEFVSGIRFGIGEQEFSCSSLGCLVMVRRYSTSIIMMCWLWFWFCDVGIS